MHVRAVPVRGSGSGSGGCRAYVSVVVVEVVVVVGTSCEVSCVIFCLVVGYGGRLNALAVHAGATLCSDVSLPPLPRLSAATDHTR